MVRMASPLALGRVMAIACALAVALTAAEGCKESGRAACASAGGHCSLGLPDDCVRIGPQNCEPGDPPYPPGGASCCLETFDDAGIAACVAAGGFCLAAYHECLGTIGPQKCQGRDGLCCMPPAFVSDAGDAGDDAGTDDGAADGASEGGSLEAGED